ncbi:hypothetical protein QTP88_004622 [Uroleucon formosanum]
MNWAHEKRTKQKMQERRKASRIGPACVCVEEKVIGGSRKGNALGTRRCSSSGLHFSLYCCISRRRSFLLLLLFVCLRDITLTIVTVNGLYAQTLNDK